ncbi:MAG: DotU family type IV/VI secretion system protein [Planctomycetia bacterium]|nr:DotU family type IV/VI secretion system protein [Planctomycetia bacterium]
MHLTDYFIELIAYVVYFQKTLATKQPKYEQVKADILRLLTQSENCLKNDFFSREDYDHARFVICAWVDEVILNSAWVQKNQWQKEQLQRIYYHTADAGEEVFERLNTLGLHQREVREVYYLCLALGFKGRYCHKSDEYLLEQLRTSNLKLLMGSSVGLPSLERAELFPEAYPVETVDVVPQRQRFRLSILTVASLAGSVLFFGLLLLIYRFVLSGVGNIVL